MRRWMKAVAMIVVLAAVTVPAGLGRERQNSSPVVQVQSAEGPDFDRATRPRGAFYLNGVGHQYLQGTEFTVVAAALPVMNGKFLGVKLRVINRGRNSVNVLPEDIAVEDSVSGKQLVLYSSAEVFGRMQQPSGMQRLAGVIGGEAGSPNGLGYGGGPTMNDLLREMMRQAAAESPWGASDAGPTLTTRGATRASLSNSAACDLGCELRNREIGDGNGPQLVRRVVKQDVLEQNEFLANTIPPEGDAVGVLYFAMPKMTDKAPISHTGRKNYQVTVVVPVGAEKFQFVFPPE